MRSSTPAPSLALLAALACACQPSDDDTTTTTGSSSTATSTSDPTTGTTTVMPTSSTGPDTPTTTTVDPSSTSTGDSSTTTTATTSDTTTTGGGMVVFPTDCDDPVVAPFAAAIADTFFINEAPGGNGCTLSGQPDSLCRDLEFGKAPDFGLFLQNDPQDPKKSLVSVLAARFAAPQPVYTGLPPELAQFEGMPVEPESWVGARLTFHVFRPEQPAPWKPVELRLLRFAAGDAWQEGAGLEFTPCTSPAASFRCRECDSGSKPCKQDWSGALPYEFPFAPVAEHALTDPPGVDGTSVEIDLPVDAVSPGAPWLLDEGVLLAPEPEFQINALAVHTLEAGQPQQRPQLGVLYCNPELVP